MSLEEEYAQFVADIEGVYGRKLDNSEHAAILNACWAQHLGGSARWRMATELAKPNSN